MRLKIEMSLAMDHLALAIEARATWCIPFEGNDAAACRLAYRCGEIATVDWLRQDSPDQVRIPNLLVDVHTLVSAFQKGRDHVLDVTVVVLAEQIVCPTEDGLVTAHFEITRNADHEYKVHWGLHLYPDAFGDAYYSFSEAFEAYEACRQAFLDGAKTGGITLFGIPVPKYEVKPKVWPTLNLLEAELA